jgi:tetratricopeptide (TPR) repeat protein
MFIFLNTFNLLPLYPLDGGAFFDLILFSRNYTIEVVFKILTSLLLIALAISLEAWFLLLIPVVILLSLKSSYYQHRAAKGVKSDLANKSIQSLTLNEEIVDRIRSRLDERAFSGKHNLKTLAEVVDATWQRVFNVPPGLIKTFSLLLLYVVSVCLAGASIVGLSVSPNQAGVHLMKEQYDQAISEACKAIELNARDSDAYNIRGVAYSMKGEPDPAISDFNKALEINPGQAGIHLNRGYAYYLKGQYDQAISDCTKAIEINPKDGHAYVDRGRYFYFQNEYDKSWEDMKRAQDLGESIPSDYLEDLRKASGRPKR